MIREEILFQKFIKALNNIKIKPSDCIPLETVKVVVGDFLRVIYTPKPIWISVKDDLPCNHDELWVMTGRLIHTKKVLVALIDGTVRLLSMLYDEVNDKWEWESKILKDKVIFWTPIPELPKE